MLFLLLCYLMLLEFSIVGEINIYMVILMFVMYAGYILLVIVTEIRQKHKLMKRNTKA